MLRRTAAKRNCASPVLFLERLLWMPAISNDEFWRQRAAEMRSIADGLAILPHAKASILRFADEDDRAGRARRGARERQGPGRLMAQNTLWRVNYSGKHLARAKLSPRAAARAPPAATPRHCLAQRRTRAGSFDDLVGASANWAPPGIADDGFDVVFAIKIETSQGNCTCPDYQWRAPGNGEIQLSALGMTDNRGDGLRIKHERLVGLFPRQTPDWRRRSHCA
jgi:hypothetical protein